MKITRRNLLEAAGSVAASSLTPATKAAQLAGKVASADLLDLIAFNAGEEFSVDYLVMGGFHNHFLARSDTDAIAAAFGISVNKMQAYLHLLGIGEPERARVICHPTFIEAVKNGILTCQHSDTEAPDFSLETLSRADFLTAEVEKLGQGLLGVLQRERQRLKPYQLTALYQKIRRATMDSGFVLDEMLKLPGQPLAGLFEKLYFYKNEVPLSRFVQGQDLIDLLQSEATKLPPTRLDYTLETVSEKCGPSRMAELKPVCERIVEITQVNSPQSNQANQSATGLYVIPATGAAATLQQAGSGVEGYGMFWGDDDALVACRPRSTAARHFALHGKAL